MTLQEMHVIIEKALSYRPDEDIETIMAELAEANTADPDLYLEALKQRYESMWN